MATEWHRGQYRHSGNAVQASCEQLRREYAYFRDTTQKLHIGRDKHEMTD
jgi:hypothetical protein